MLAQRWAKGEPEIGLLPALCPSHLLAVDIGAHRGFYTWFLLRQTTRVVAFDPLPLMQRLLRQQYGDTISIQDVALSDRTGECLLRFPADAAGLATISAKNRLQMSEDNIVAITVRSATLDSYEFANVGFIKIDVEGHEESVLRGASRTLMRDLPNLIVEIEERHAPGATVAVPALLQELGYDGYYLDGGQILDIAEFASDRDQPAANISGGEKIGRYINNFIFIRRDKAQAMRRRLQRLIGAASP